MAEQRRAQAVAVRAVGALIAGLVAAVLDEIDLDEVVARVDLNRIVDRINLNQIAARIDLDEIVRRVDIDAIAGRIDLDAIASRIDLDAIVARVDLDAIVGRVDLAGLTEQVMDEVDLGEIIRESSSTMASETVDALRVQGMRVDGLVSRIVDRILSGRESARRAPPRRAAAMNRDIRYAEARALQGHRAGFASRVVADALDLVVAWLLGLAALLAAGVVHTC